MQEVVKCIKINKFFNKGKIKKNVINNLDFTMKEREIHGIIGLNGAGKTTFVRMLSGILKQDSGEIEIFGKTYNKFEKEIKKSIGVVLGGDRSMYYKLTAYENLRFFAKLYEVNPKQIHDKIILNLERVGLLEVKDDLVETFSKGMKQRLLIAKALLNNPKLLILDEPTSGLDISGQFEVRSLIKELNVAENLTVLLFTHYLSEANELCDDIKVLHKGRLINADTLSNLSKNGGYNAKLTLISKKRINLDEDIIKTNFLVREETRHTEGYQYILYFSDTEFEYSTLMKDKEINSLKTENLELEDYLFIQFQNLDGDNNG